MRHVARQSKILPRRPAFTLVELLVVMGVLAMMSSLVLVGLASAAEQARVSRTRSQVQKIHELLMTRWEDYRYRRVPPLTVPPGDPRPSPRKRQEDRVDKIRELMRMEMPDRRSDLDSTAVVLPESPTLWDRYRRTIVRRTGAADWASAYATLNGDHESSECLYMILESIQDGETNGLDFFKNSEIGDIDNDGLPEILDAWGQPILFIRWPFGFPQLATSGNYKNALSNLVDQSAPDPFDPLNVRNGKLLISTSPPVYAHYPLYPLVFSAGPDGIFNIRTDIGGSYAATIPPNNPYAEGSGTPPARVGQINDESGEELDNITNHVLVIGGNSP